MGGVNPMMGGGAMGTNGLGEPAMNAGFGGAHGINVGAMGYNPAGHANVVGIGHQNPQGGMMGRGVPIGGVFPWQAAQQMRARAELDSTPTESGEDSTWGKRPFVPSHPTPCLLLHQLM